MKTEQLAQLVGKNEASLFADPLTAAFKQFDINTVKRQAAFLAQTIHESAAFTRLVENLNYSANGLVATWPSRFTPAEAEHYARKPQQIANRVYGGRMGNGDEKSGDGWLYRGRGLIQLTGKANYKAAGEALSIPLLTNPELLETPHTASLSAAWYWQKEGLNQLADSDAFDNITRRINGGTKGAAERKSIWEKAKKILGA